MAIIIKRKVATPIVAAELAKEAIVPVSPAEALKAYPTLTRKAAGEVMDGEAMQIIANAPNAIVGWWLMASYLYYVHHESLLSDACYDDMARVIKASWDKLTHPHKHLITRHDLEAGTLYALKPEDYPLMTRAAAKACVKASWGLLIEIGG
jgi:hypothetical protein